MPAGGGIDSAERATVFSDLPSVLPAADGLVAALCLSSTLLLDNWRLPACFLATLACLLLEHGIVACLLPRAWLAATDLLPLVSLSLVAKHQLAKAITRLSAGV